MERRAALVLAVVFETSFISNATNGLCGDMLEIQKYTIERLW